MKHDDTTLQAAIDAAMIEIETGTPYRSLVTYESCHWHKEAPARLRLAKAFLAKLPEPEPILADDGRSLTDLRADNIRLEKELAHQTDMGCQAAVCGPNVALDEAIRRMEAVPMEALRKVGAGDPVGLGGPERKANAVRARLIAAARGEEKQTVQQSEAKSAPSTFEARGKTWTRHTPGDPMPCDEYAEVFCIGGEKLDTKSRPAHKWSWAKLSDHSSITGWRYADEPDITDWKARAEKAEAELAAPKSSQIGILRPLAEAGPVPDGCARIYGVYDPREDRWPSSTWKEANDTHFADIRLPVTETSAPTVNEAADPYARLKAYAKAGARIRFKFGSTWKEWVSGQKWSWCLPPEDYEVYNDDLHMVPDYAPVNEQPKQQVPLGPEDVMPGSIVTNSANAWYKVKYVTAGGIRIDTQGSSLIDYEELKTNGWSINTSLAFGRWDANAWQPCYKLI